MRTGHIGRLGRLGYRLSARGQFPKSEDHVLSVFEGESAVTFLEVFPEVLMGVYSMVIDRNSNICHKKPILKFLFFEG